MLKPRQQHLDRHEFPSSNHIEAVAHRHLLHVWLGKAPVEPSAMDATSTRPRANGVMALMSDLLMGIHTRTRDILSVLVTVERKPDRC